MREKVESVFAEDLLELSPKALEYVEILWMVHNMSLPVPLKFISFHLGQYQPWEIENKIKIMSESGLITWFGGGELNSDSLGKSLIDAESSKIFVTLDNKLKSLLAEKNPSDKDAFKNIVFNYAGKRIMFYCRNKLIDFLVTALQMIILDAEPKKPVFMGKLIRDLYSIWKISPYEIKQILYYYMHKFLGLVEIEDGIFIKLSEKAIKKMEKDNELFKIYTKEYRPEIKIEPPSTPIWSGEELKKIREQFPWVGT